MKRLILASASPRRAELLRQLGLDFTVIPSNVSEDFPERPTAPAELVERLALLKAEQVASQIAINMNPHSPGMQSGEAFVIGADTVVVLEGHILEKPQNPEEAATMLASLSDREHSVFTGLAICEMPGGCCRVSSTETRVRFRKLSSRDIKTYLASGEPFDKAGAYGIQGKGAAFVSGITGCYFNVVGLPLSQLVIMLEDFGGSVW